MSELFMDMHRNRRQNLHYDRRNQNQAAADSCSNSSLNTSAYSDHHNQNIANVNVNDDDYDANEAADEISNILSLKLKKPKHWKWELTTSRSCMNIALPRILLYDHNGKLLVDVNTQEEQIYKDPTNDYSQNNNKTKHPSRSRKRSVSRSASANLAHSIRQVLNQEFDGLQIEEATPTPTLQSPATSTTPQQTRNSSPLASSSCIDIYTNNLPDYKNERRSSSLRGVRFNDDDNDAKSSGNNSFQINGLPTPPPSSGTTPTTGTSSSSGPREKRRYRRSHSSGRSGPVNSPSILERFSFNKGRFSSPEYAEEQEVYRPPRYFLRTSKAGTLVVQEESFSRYRRRPTRSKLSSSENLPNENLLRQLSTNSFKFKEVETPQRPSSPTGSLQHVAPVRSRKKLFPIRRLRSDGNVLLQANNLSSDKDEGEDAESESGMQRPRHRYNNLKRHLKEELVTLEPDNGVFHPFGSPTER